MPNSKLFDLSRRVAFVTGGNGGLGRAIALGFADAGASVAILARNAEKNKKVLAELQAIGARAIRSKLILPTARRSSRPLRGFSESWDRSTFW